jgi:hypothetical protein
MAPDWRGIAAALALLMLAGCGLFATQKPGLPCPRASLVDGAERVQRFAGQNRTLNDLAFEARILDVTGQCEVADNKVTIEMKLRIEGAKGPALKGTTAPLSYFVAIIGPEGRVLVRDEFATEIPFKDQTATIEEDLEPVIPLAEGQRPAAYTVFVGLVVTQEELDANRKR